MSYKPRFPECHDCRFFNPVRPTPNCIRCGNGEFFEERNDVPAEMSEHELMAEFTRMHHDNDEE